MLARSPKIRHVNKRHFSDYNFPANEQWIWQRRYDADYNSFWARLTYSLSKGLLKQDFLDIYLTTFSESVISEIQKLWGSSFFSKCSKSNFDFKNAAKNFEIFFCFLDNWIWIGTVKLFLWRTRYFSSAANVLTSSPKIWHVNKRDFFQLNFLGSDRWIW